MSTFQGVIAGEGKTVTVSNPATRLILSGSNTHTGATTVIQGILQVTNAGALGTAAAGTDVQSGGTLALGGAGHISIGAEALSIQGAGTHGTGALSNLFGDNSWGGPVSLLADATLSVSAGRLALNGGLTNNSAGAGHILTKIGRGSLVIGGPQSWGPGSVFQIGDSGTGGGSPEYVGDSSPNSVPEPATLAMLAAGGLCLLAHAWRRRERVCHS